MSDGQFTPEIKLDKIRITEPATKLRDFLGTVVVDESTNFDETSVVLGNALADYLNDEGLVPMGFVMGTQLFIGDCIRNKNGYTGNPMPSELIGFPDIIYKLFQFTSVDMARGAYGDEFADETQAIYDRVSQ